MWLACVRIGLPLRRAPAKQEADRPQFAYPDRMMLVLAARRLTRAVAGPLLWPVQPAPWKVASLVLGPSRHAERAAIKWHGLTGRDGRRYRVIDRLSRVVVFAGVLATAHDAHARWPEDDCQSARADLRALHRAVDDARNARVNLERKLDDAKSSKQWKDALDGLVTGARMTVTVVKQAYTLATSPKYRLLIAKEVVTAPLATLDRLLGIPDARELSKRLEQREAAIKLLAESFTAARNAVSALSSSETEAEAGYRKVCGSP